MDDESIDWDYVRRGGASSEEDIITTLHCMRCEFAFPWPCGNLRSEMLMETMRFIATGGTGREWDIPGVEVG